MHAPYSIYLRMVVDVATDTDIDAQRLQSSSFLVMTYFLLRDYNILPKKELHLSPWVRR